MRSRAAILPTMGDPFLLHYWLELFYRVWSNEVDKLYIICHTQAEKEVVEYLEFLGTGDSAKIEYIFLGPHKQHGDTIRVGLEKATEKYVMLIEDDAFVFKPGQVDWCFKQLESGEYDIVGSKRGSCHDEISNRAKELWGTTIDGAGDQGCNFWPCYFFSTRDLLLQTDRDYNARAWVQGEIIAPLHGYDAVAPVVAGDTFVSASLQLRNLVPENRILYVPQYHAHPDDVNHYERKAEFTPFDGKACWTHIGSLSSGVDGLIMDDQGRNVARRTIDPPKGPTVLPNYCNTEMETMEMERRVQFWLTFWENRDPDEIKDYATIYKYGIDQMITQYKLNPKHILERQKIYKEAFNL